MEGGWKGGRKGEREGGRSEGGGREGGRVGGRVERRRERGVAIEAICCAQCPVFSQHNYIFQIVCHSINVLSVSTCV